MDLHAATDRYPAILQRAVLGTMVQSKEYSDAWYRLMVGKPFHNPWGEPLSYGRGQPMGAYSSWAVFTVCHHLTVRTAARLAGLNPAKYTQYCLLGDDIVLTNPKVAEKYSELMDKLGVELSDAKTHVSDDTFEFAKRWYQAGTEISGFPLSAIVNITNWSSAAEELSNLCSRWSLTPQELETGSILSYLSALGLRIRDTEKVVAFLHLPKKADTQEVRQTKIDFFANLLFRPAFGCFPRQAMKEIFILQTLAEVKTGELEAGIQRIFKESRDLLWDLQKRFAGKLPDQGALPSLPPVAAVRTQAMILQESFDQLRAAYYENDEDIVFAKVMASLHDPTRVMSKRNSTIVLEAQVTILYKYKRWAQGYWEKRELLLSSSDPPPDGY
jgi:hypothetical protein